MTRGRFGRQDKLFKEKRHDVYEKQEKWPEPTRCTECRALFSGGRWTWKETEAKAHEAVCPACRRIADRFPAASLEIRGEFYPSHREEIINLVRNIEAQQKAAHPLERIIELETGNGGATVTTTDIHLARRIGEALLRSYKGDFTFQYGDGEKSLRGVWER